MIYVCAGMCRSGSTWLYNAVRLILAHAGIAGCKAGWISERESLLKNENAVIKIHAFDAELASPANVILTSHRDLRDVAASLRRKFKTPFSVEDMRGTVETHERWSALANYELHYENLLGDKMGELLRLARSLRLPDENYERLRFDAILRELEGEEFCEARSTPQRYDAVNLLHDGHITDGRHGSWDGVLARREIAQIEREFRPWLEARGYLPRVTRKTKWWWRGFSASSAPGTLVTDQSRRVS